MTSLLIYQTGDNESISIKTVDQKAAYVIADYPIKSIRYINQSFDLEFNSIDNAIDDLLENGRTIDRFIKSLAKIAYENAYADSIADYLENEYGYYFI